MWLKESGLRVQKLSPTNVGSIINTIRDTYVLVVDSSCYIRTSVSVRKGNIWGINVDNLHKGEVFFNFVFISSILCTFTMAIENFEVNIDVQEAALSWEKTFTLNVLDYIWFMFSSIIIISCSSMTTMSIIVMMCIGVLGNYKPKALGVLIGSLDLFSKLMYCCLWFFDTIVE